MKNREEMVPLVGEYEKSCMTQKRFNESKGIGFHKFNYWYRKLKREEDSSGCFLKIDSPAPIEDIRMELVYPNGVVLKVDSADPHSLPKRLLNVQIFLRSPPNSCACSTGRKVKSIKYRR